MATTWAVILHGISMFRLSLFNTIKHLVLFHLFFLTSCLRPRFYFHFIFVLCHFISFYFYMRSVKADFSSALLTTKSYYLKTLAIRAWQ